MTLRLFLSFIDEKDV